MRSTFGPLVVSLLVVAGACSPTSPDGGGGAGGAGASTGGAGGGGRGGTTGGAGRGGSTTGGTAGGGSGGSSTGGAGAGGSGGSTGGAGGGGAGGSGGSGPASDAKPVDVGGGEAGGGSDVAPYPDGGPPGGRPVKPSAGCGKANPTNGMRTITTGGRQGTFIVNVPAGYDPNTPMNLGFAFHGFGNGACTGECAGFRNLPAVTVFPKSLSTGWEGVPLEMNITFFQDLVALMKNEYCVDENRIFVAGTSSGGQFVEHLACRFGDWLWAVSPVAAFIDRGTDMNCKGTPPVIVIHGVTDGANTMNGQTVAEMFARRNGCSATAPAGIPMARTDLRAAYDARRGEFRCFDWAMCTANPVRYCLFSHITYNNLTHGWPSIGGMLIGEFLTRLK